MNAKLAAPLPVADGRLAPGLGARPCWPDEIPRAKSLAADWLHPLAGRGAAGIRFYGLFKERPVERLVGAIAWADSLTRPGVAVFTVALSGAMAPLREPLLREFREFVVASPGSVHHTLMFADMIPELAAGLDDFRQAGFIQGAINESFSFPFLAARERARRLDRRFGSRMALPPGSVVTVPRRTQLPDLLRLCAGMHELMSPTAIESAFKETSTGVRPGFDPSASGVYLEDGEVRGALLCQRVGEDLHVPARVVDPRARIPPGRVCQWLFDHVIAALDQAQPVQVHVRAEPRAHAETVRLVKRYRGRYTGRSVQMQARRERLAHVFCVGIGPFGPVVPAALWQGAMRSAHEPGTEALIAMLDRRRTAHVGTTELDDFLRRRDRELELEFESSALLWFVLDRLVEVFPQAHFVTLVPDPAVWLGWMRARSGHLRVREVARSFVRTSLGLDLESGGADSTTAYLNFWNHQFESCLQLIPPSRHLVLTTMALEQDGCRRLAEFLGLPAIESMAHPTHNALSPAGDSEARPPAAVVESLCPLWGRYKNSSP